MKGTPLTEDSYQYICDLFPAEDEFLRELNAEAETAGIPAIQISPEQLAFLQVFLRAMNARFVLEIGSLAGYSAIGMARALPEDAKVVCIEIEKRSVDFIHKKAEEAGLSHKIHLVNGNALDVLKDLEPGFLFDFVFIDADKPNYAAYLELSLPLTRKGGVIAGDNALAWGKISDLSNTEPDVIGMQNFNRALSEHPQLQGCVVPVGDGMAMGVKL